MAGPLRELEHGSGMLLRHAPTRCLVLTRCMALRVPGSEAAVRATRAARRGRTRVQPPPLGSYAFPMLCPVLTPAVALPSLRTPFAVSGTDGGYAPTRQLWVASDTMSGAEV
eukprot:677412-Rhodomonas_salina.1